MDSSFDSRMNRIVLKPRFQMHLHEQKDQILTKFRDSFADGFTELSVTVVGDHIIIDVAKEHEHFWSPQLQLEVEDRDDNTSIVKGHYGPKPSLWTLFMFIHFGVALAFAIFATMLYTDLSLYQDYRISLLLTIAMPVLWVAFYLFGRWGKKKGHAQMQEIDAFMKRVLSQ